jgi:small subunit ribosomal protein S8
MQKKVKQSSDTLSDSLTRMRNAITRGKSTAVLPNTKLILELLKVLSNYGYISSYTQNDLGDIEVNLMKDGQYRFTHLERVSKPGVRRYISSAEIKPVKGGKGLAILSTSKGVLAGPQAKKENVGGEFICKIW